MTLQSLIDQNKEAFINQFGRAPEIIAQAPGRINVLGEHTDYCFGFSLPAAIDRWTTACVRKRSDNKIHVFSVDYQKELETDTLLLENTEKWHTFVLGCLIELFLDKEIPFGFELSILSNVPVGSGISSSASASLAIVTALDSLYNTNKTELERALICQKVEHNHMGTMCGLLDQFASQFSEKKHLLKLDFQSLEIEKVPFDTEEYVFLLINTNVKRELASCAYGDRVKETQEGLKSLEQFGIKHFREIDSDHLAKIEPHVSRQRLAHVFHENERVELAIEALKQHNFYELGLLMNESHRSLRDVFEVSCEELDFLQDLAIQNPACLGSRMMGGGFGGSTINLVHKTEAETLAKQLEEIYLSEFEREASSMICNIVDGASIYLA